MQGNSALYAPTCQAKLPLRQERWLGFDPAFAKTGGAGYQQVLMARNPAAIGKMGHDTAVKAAWRAQVTVRREARKWCLNATATTDVL